MRTFPAGAPALMWFRRDLRVHDNPALAAALATGRPMACGFVLDRDIFPHPESSARWTFLFEGLRDLDASLRTAGGGLIVRRGASVETLARLVSELGAAEVHACADDSPFARARDSRATSALAELGVTATFHDDLTVVPHDAVDAEAGREIKRYAPYRRLVERLAVEYEHETTSEPRKGMLLRPSLPAQLPEAGNGGGETAALERLRQWASGGLPSYAEHRDDIANPGATSRLSPYLKFGMLSPRRARAAARAHDAAKWLSELTWREFAKYALHRHPDIAERCVDERFERLRWTGTDAQFERWTRGETGVPLVDAGMRQLSVEGWQPNRVRMVCAGFLVKHLHIDWRRGERWFRDHLVDGDLAANALNWQWVAGTAPESMPWFRVFNPLLQAKTFDPDGGYVARWAADAPSEPMVDLGAERRRALALYGNALGRPG